jgi:predicted alpha/beta-fold hydrolase
MLPDAELVGVELEKSSFTADDVSAFLARAAEIFDANPFKPHRVFKNGHAQTIAAFFWPRGFRFRSVDEERLFQVAPDAKVLAHCRWQPSRKEHPTFVIWHGIEGSSYSIYMRASAHKAFQLGFNVIRMNLRTCGGTEHLTPTIYHGGLSADLRVVVDELIKRDHLPRIFLVGYSLGGNLVLKLAGEYGDNPPEEVLGVCAVSPSVDLSASADLILKRSNRIYHIDFLRRLKRRMRAKHKFYPELYDISRLASVRTIREFDDRFTAVANGFAGADDYYYKSSSLHVIDKIRIPTLVVHGRDDPFIPFAPLRSPGFTNNPYILLLAPEQGGHVAFISAKPHNGKNGDDSSPMTHDSPLIEDRFWAENRVVEFCKLANDIL